MSEPFEIGERIGDAVLLGEPFAHSSTFSVSHAAWLRHGAPRLVVVKRVHEHAMDAEEHLAFFLETLRMRAAMGAAHVPAVLQVLGRGGHALASVEENAGDVSIRELVRALARGGPTPLALGLVAASVMARAFASLASAAPGLHHAWAAVAPSGVRVGWSGEVRILTKPYPGPDQQVHGAAVGVVSASFQWLAPEIIVGGEGDALGPMFSVGMMLWEALTGRYPFGDESTLAVLRALIEDDVPDLATVRPDAPPALRALVSRATAKGRRRFGDWAEMVGAIDDALAEVEPLAAADVRAMLARAFPARFEEANRRDEAVARMGESELGVGVGAAEAPAEGSGVFVGGPYRVAAARESEAVASAPTALEPMTLAPWSVVSVGDGDDAGDDDVTLPRRVASAPATRAESLVAVAWGNDARPMARVDDTLLVDLQPVTCAEYARFVLATGHTAPAPWRGLVPRIEDEERPITNVTAHDAMAYARWAGKRVPTNEEWERAVRALGADRLGTGGVWEWTANGFKSFGWVVRGGAWRNRAAEPPRFENQSFEAGPAADVGFRCVADA